MRLFNRRNTPPAADTTADTTADPTAADTTDAPGRKKKSGWFGRREPRTTQTGTSSWNTRPRFGQWIKATALDLITMVIMGAIGLGIYEADPAPSRSFPVTFQNGNVVYPQFAYPLRHEIVPIWLAALLAFFVPFIVFLIVQIKARSFWDLNNATIGLLYSLITAAVFQVFVKWLIGGLRPHFLTVCEPVIPDLTDGNGFRQIMFDRSICTGDKKKIDDSLESMPSGHTTAAFAGFVFLYLYLNAKLKVFANYHPAMWKLIAIYAPILGACLIAGALTIDEYHNWYDVLAGAVIGTVMAFSAYRMVYASVWDFRFNHIPLLRHSPFVYGAGPSSFDGFHDALFTRRAGWGTHDGGSWGGAPFDAADGPRGTMPEGKAGHHMNGAGRMDGAGYMDGAGHRDGVGHTHHTHRNRDRDQLNHHRTNSNLDQLGTSSSRVQRKPIPISKDSPPPPRPISKDPGDIV